MIAVTPSVTSANSDATTTTRSPDSTGLRASLIKQITVVIVDDHAMIRSALAQILNHEPDISVIGDASDGKTAIELVRLTDPDVVLMDISMPGTDGIAATRAITATCRSHVIMLTSFADRERIMDSLDAGAVGYLLKDADPTELPKAIRTAINGASPIDPRVSREIISGRLTKTSAPQLSKREIDVLRLVAEGLSNKAIARQLGIAEKTVKAHMTAIFNQLGVTDRTQAALWATRHELPR